MVGDVLVCSPLEQQQFDDLGVAMQRRPVKWGVTGAIALVHVNVRGVEKNGRDGFEAIPTTHNQRGLKRSRGPIDINLWVRG